MQPVPIGVAGEVYIGGAQLARGYLNRGDKTAEMFVPNPFSQLPGARLYRTGDLARFLSGGELDFMGRIDHQVKLRGFRIELGEIAAVLDEHPAVGQSLVVALEHGPDDKRLVAYVAVDADRAPTASELREFLKRQLPVYMVPAAFVMLDELPLTPNGKVDRAQLSAPESSRSPSDETFVAPRTATERAIAEIWANQIGLERIGIHDNFFDAGGHSLLAAQVAARMSKVLDVDVSVQMLFSHPTIASIMESRPCHSQSGTRLSRRTVVARPVPASPPSHSSNVSQGTPSGRRTVSLSALIKRGDIAPVDSAALGYWSDLQRDRSDLGRDEFLRHVGGDRVELTRILELSLGRIGVITLPRFQCELYDSESGLVKDVIDALETARQIGASIVSLTGLIPSATDYGRAIVRKIGKRSGLPVVTTGHGATVATVVLAIESILQESRRDMRGETVAFVGVGSIGHTALRLMLRTLPHPAAILLADVFVKQSQLEQVRRELREDLGYRGPVHILEVQREVPSAMYQATLIVGATNVSGVLDVARLQPGTLLVDDSAPHCFSTSDAIRRFGRQGDILFTEGGVLKAPEAVLNIRPLRKPSWSGKRTKCRRSANITGCVLSSLLSSRFDDLAPTLGFVDDDVALRHLDRLRELRFQSAKLHCGGYTISSASVRSFRRRFSRDRLHISEEGPRERETRTPLQSAQRAREGDAANGVESWGPEELAKPLVPIQVGGSRLPLFCVHAAIGSATCFIDLAHQLGTDQPFYGLQSQGIAEGSPPLKTVEEMAASYLRAIRTIQPRGPYLVGGWSMGGIIALEMSQQLQADGDSVALLALLDTYISKSQASAEAVTELITFGLHLGLPVGAEGLGRAHLEALAPHERFCSILQTAREQGAVPPNCDLAYLRRLFHVHQSNIQAVQTYVPTSYSGNVTLFRAGLGFAERRRRSSRRWRELFPGQLNIESVPGNHYTMLQGTNATVLAKRLRQCVDRIIGHSAHRELSK
jgi:thioesterase domain-containing protein